MTTISFANTKRDINSSTLCSIAHQSAWHQLSISGRHHESAFVRTIKVQTFQRRIFSTVGAEGRRTSCSCLPLTLCRQFFVCFLTLDGAIETREVAWKHNLCIQKGRKIETATGATKGEYRTVESFYVQKEEKEEKNKNQQFTKVTEIESRVDLYTNCVPF